MTRFGLSGLVKTVGTTLTVKLELRNRLVLEIYKLIWAELYPYSFFNLGKNHQLTTDVYDSHPAKSPSQFSAILSICLNMLFYLSVS